MGSETALEIELFGHCVRPLHVERHSVSIGLAFGKSQSFDAARVYVAPAATVPAVIAVPLAVLAEPQAPEKRRRGRPPKDKGPNGKTPKNK